MSASPAVENQSAARPRSRRRPRHWRSGNSVIANGEPMLWLTGAGLVFAIMMIATLLTVILLRGLITFWPVPMLQVRTLDGRQLLGELAQRQKFDLTHSLLDTLSGTTKDAAMRLLNPRLAAACQADFSRTGAAESLARVHPDVARNLRAELASSPVARNAPAADRAAHLLPLQATLEAPESFDLARLAERLQELVGNDPTGNQLYEYWSQARVAKDNWLSQADLAVLRESFAGHAELRQQIWAQAWLARFASDVVVHSKRALLRTGNFELTNEHFTWVADFEIEEQSATEPEWAVVLERQRWGRFYGHPRGLQLPDQRLAGGPDEVWKAFQEYWPDVRARWAEGRRLEHEIGELSRRQNAVRLKLREIELRSGSQSPVWQTANTGFEAQRQELSRQSDALRSRIAELNRTNEAYRLVLETATGQEHEVALTEIVRAYPANRLGWGEKLAIYLDRWREFLLEAPREANSEGGVLPAIFGTVAMTLMMTLIVVPFGVLAALYLKEYAREGFMVRVVRIAVNNLAGVPSIVFGVFGLGFFCYLIGARIDQVFYSANLPSPTFGTGGLLWSALTLALLTVPVVIVSSEEALAAVPNSLREGSYACGASKWQTIRRIVLPHALPGVMTGMILAMARGAGEVAPLMLVGAVKLADDLPVDGVFPYLHLERSFMHLGFHIFDLGFQSPNSDAAKPMVFTTTLLLIVVIATLNVLAVALRARLRRHFRTGHF